MKNFELKSEDEWIKFIKLLTEILSFNYFYGIFCKGYLFDLMY